MQSNVELPSIGVRQGCKAGTDAPSFGEFSTLPERKEHAPCPHSNLTSSSPSGNSSKPSLPEHRTDHPLGCHRSRIPERVVFEKLVAGVGLRLRLPKDRRRSCSESTLASGGRVDRARADGATQEICLEAYDRLIGLELSEVAVDCCSPRPLVEGRRREGARWTAGNGASSARWRWTPRASRWGRERPRQPPRLAAFGPDPRRPQRRWELPEGASVHLDRGYDSKLTRERLEDLGLGWEISRKGKPAPYGPRNVGWWSARTRGTTPTRSLFGVPSGWVG